MLKLNFLCGDSENKVERDFMLPLIINKKRLGELGLDVRLFSKMDSSLTDCDILCIVSGYIRLYRNNEREMDLLKKIIMEANRCFLFETTDSTGAFATQFIPMVERYYKKQLLKNRGLYLNDLYNKRIVFDYYHRNYNINEKISTVYKNDIRESDLDKFRLSWNVGLGDYYPYPRFVRRFLRNSIYSLIDPAKKLDFKNVKEQRDIDILNCFSLYDNLSTVLHFHRKTVDDTVKKSSNSYKICSDFLPRKKYFKLLENSKLSICPLGWGEISWKDFESFIGGSVVVKPDMDFMETWPDYYKAGETYQACNWDFNDLEEKVVELLENDGLREHIAEQGQVMYMSTISDKGKIDFCTHFNKIIS